MANTKSAIKRIRRIAKQTLVNKARKEQIQKCYKKNEPSIEKRKKMKL